MGNKELEHIVGERELAATTASAERVGIKVQIGSPRRYPDETGYECPLRITGPGIDVTQWMGGLDSVQALQAALYIIPFYVNRVCQDRGFTNVHWTEVGDNLGFPPIAGEGQNGR
jgi:hypothetical protein